MTGALKPGLFAGRATNGILGAFSLHRGRPESLSIPDTCCLTGVSARLAISPGGRSDVERLLIPRNEDLIWCGRRAHLPDEIAALRFDP
jgi:hypothetical protein